MCKLLQDKRKGFLCASKPAFQPSVVNVPCHISVDVQLANVSPDLGNVAGELVEPLDDVGNLMVVVDIFSTALEGDAREDVFATGKAERGKSC